MAFPDLEANDMRADDVLKNAFAMPLENQFGLRPISFITFANAAISARSFLSCSSGVVVDT